jgi:NTP pyrophosphatase (non-canonical NTP hydrolase)
MTDDAGTDFDAYQHWTRSTAIYPMSETGAEIAIFYTALGLANEAGEVAGKLKKWIRDGVHVGETEADGAARFAQNVADEAGDVLWYLSRLLDEIGVSLGDVAAANQRKLMDRKNRGVIGGSGDKR